MDPRTQHLIEWIAGIILLAAFIGVVFFWRIAPQAPAEHSGYESLQRLLPPGTPPPTAADLVTAQHGFNELIQYTDAGFHPATLTVKVGDTVRIANTSQSAIRVAPAGTDDASAPCVTGTFDSCHAIVRGGYWEYTTTKAGTISYSDGLGHSATITVK